MSVSTLAFTIYLFIGLGLMTVAIASEGKEKRVKGWESSGGGGFEFFILITIAIFWPVWIFTLFKKKPDDKPEDTQHDSP